MSSTLDLDYVRQIASDIKSDLICNVCTDQAHHTAAVVSEAMGLPTYISAETARKVTNMSYMKKVLMENHIPTSKYYVIHDLSEAYKLADTVLCLPIHHALTDNDIERVVSSIVKKLFFS